MNFEFCDLCVNQSGDFNELKSILDRLHKGKYIGIQEYFTCIFFFSFVKNYFTVGYRTVAINQIVDEAVLNNDKKKKRKVDSGEEITVSAVEPLKIDNLIKLFEGKLKILKRLSFTFNDPSKIHFLVQ